MAQNTIFRYLAPKPSSTDGTHLEEDKTGQTSVQTIALEDTEPRGPAKTPQTRQSHNGAQSVKTLQDGAPISSIPSARIARVEPSHIDAIKRLTSTTLPMRYPDKFYNEVTTEQVVGDLARVALFEGKPIGWIRCRLEPTSPLATSNSPACQIYIQALCLLAPYRQRGVASQLLQEVTHLEVLQKYGVASIYAHVWENNEDALEWYEKRGFTQVILVDQYYKRLRPSGAWIVRKELE